MTSTTSVAEPTAVSSDVSSKIMKQVEFYFSDANLPRDRFLQEELKKNEEGWIELAVISSFKRMQVLSTDLTQIAEAVKTSELLEVSEDGMNVRRSTPAPEAPADCMKMCVFVRGFPVDLKLEDLQGFFAKVVTGGEEGIAAIRLRRQIKTKEFKGSVFLQLKSEEEVSRLLALEKLTFKTEGDLDIWSMTAFMEDQNAKHLARKSSSSASNNESSDATPSTVEDLKKMLLTVTGCPADLDHRLLRTALASKGPIAFVENVDAEGCSVARFKEAIAEELIAAITQEGGIQLPSSPDSPLQVRAVSDEEASAFFAKMQEFKAKAKADGGKPRFQNRNKRFKRS